MLDSLIFINIIIPIFSCCISSFNRHGLRFDHVFIVSAAYIYFWIIPLTVYRFKLFTPLVREEKFASSFSLENIILSEDDQLMYLTCILSIYLAFIIGEIISRQFRFKRYKLKYFTPRPFHLLLILYTFILIVLTFTTKEFYFKGYAREFFSLQGNVIALNLVLLLLMYLMFFNTNIHNKFTNIFKNWYFFIYLISTLLLVSLGNRTWFICGLLSFFILYTNYYKRISLLLTVLGFISLILVLGILPIVRTGDWKWLSTEIAVYLAFYDTFATHNSLKYFIVNNDLQLFNIPSVLISKIFNIIPSTIMPSKEILYYAYEDVGANVISVQSASHTFALLMIHFGFMGTIILAFISPFLLNYLKHSIMLSAIYIFVVAHMAAPMFRDFDNFAVKILLQFSLIMPLIYLSICSIYGKLTSSRNV